VLKQNKAGEFAVWYGLFERAGVSEQTVRTTIHVERSAI
jgi:hypothetical protein